MIVATAGHIDHGKTLLVKALTGVDADRLPEEKKRGLTIDLGFAYRPLPDGSVLGFIDVPGHERFIRNMLAGVIGIDYALLVIAADDGPMPQTREHLAILDLLGVTAGVVAITKIDRVTPERIVEVIAQIRALVAGTGLTDAPMFPVSALTGDGVPALSAHIDRAARAVAARQVRGNFRLAVDRCFTLAGSGVIVTGTVFSGSVKIGDRLVLSPNGLAVRVRGIHAQNRETHAGRAGQRCALNIAGQGLNKSVVHRGDWVLAEPVHAPVRRFDARIKLLAGEERPLKDGTPVHVHAGAADVTGRVAILEGREISPGASALVRVNLDRAIGALQGDRLILRDQSARRTMAGGRIVDPFPPTRGIRTPARLGLLAAHELDDAAAALGTLLEKAPGGIDLGRFLVGRNLVAAEIAALKRRVEMVTIGGNERPIALAPAMWGALRRDIRTAMERWHKANPESAGPTEAELRRMLGGAIPAVPFRAAVADLIRGGGLTRDGRSLRLPSHQAAFTGAEAALWERIAPLLESDGLRPPRVRELGEMLAVDWQAVERLLQRAARTGQVVRVVDNRYFLPRTLAGLAAVAEAAARASADGRFNAAVYRDRSGIGRTLTIEVLEYFDKVGLTRREGNERRIVRPAAELFGADTAESVAP